MFFKERQFQASDMKFHCAFAFVFAPKLRNDNESLNMISLN